MIKGWVKREISRGLQGLVVLRLAGSPAEDSITLTRDIWLAAIAPRAAQWSEEQDAPRIQQAFRVLYQTCDRWPAPRQFLDSLPPPPQRRALPQPKFSAEERACFKERLNAIWAELDGKKRFSFDGDAKNE